MAKQILIIDDDSDYRGYLDKLLTKHGYNVSLTGSSLDAFKGLSKAIPDIIITDIIMPDMDGLELIRKIKSKYPNIKIIAISGGGRIKPDLYLDMASKLKADSVLEKPFKKEELLNKINFLLTEVL